MTQTDSSGVNTDTWYDAEEIEALPGDPDCKVCRGSGFVHPRLANGKPDFSRVAPCRCALDKLAAARRQHLEQYANQGVLKHYRFENLPDGGQNREFREAVAAARAFAAEPRGWLVLNGASGAGKTHLAAAIANYRLAQAQPAIFVSVPDLLDHLRATYSPDSEITYDALFQQMRDTPLLVLDDLGAQSSTAWAREKLEQLLNHRYHNDKPTVIVAIVPLSDISERLRRRFEDSDHCRIITLTAPNAPLSSSAGGMDLKLLKSMTFASFDEKRVNLPVAERQNLAMVYRECQEFAKNPEGWLVLLGNNGCGKTHLACAIANQNLKAGKALQFVVVPDFLDHLRATFSPDSKVSYDTLFENVRESPLLILDDLGAQSATPWAREKLYQVINYRYNARLPIVITTNCDLDDIDDRISSRLADPKISIIFNITAPDYRSDAIANKKKTRRRGARED